VRTNNLALSRKKTREIVFRDSRKKCLVSPQPPMADIEHVTTLKILGVTVTNTLSTSEHVCEVIKSCAQTQYALRILRAHGLSDGGLHTVFRSVAVAKMMYASCAWSGLVNKHDEQRIDAFLRRNKKCGFCQPDLPLFQELCDTAGEQLFDKIQHNKHHLLRYFLYPRLPHSATISGDDHTLSCFRNTVDTLWTLTSYTESITSLLFIVVRNMLCSVKHGHQSNMLCYLSIHPLLLSLPLSYSSLPFLPHRRNDRFSQLTDALATSIVSVLMCAFKFKQKTASLVPP